MPINLMWFFLYKGHKTHKIRKTDKNKEIISWISHLTADLTHIHNKNLKKRTISKMLVLKPWHLQPIDLSAETNIGLLNTQTSSVQILKLWIISEEWRRILRRVLEIKFSSHLSFHLLSQNWSSQGSVKTRMKTQKVPKHNGSQNFEVWMITLLRYRKSRRKVDLAVLLATKIRVKIIPYTQNQNYQKVWYSWLNQLKTDDSNIWISRQ